MTCPRPGSRRRVRGPRSSGRPVNGEKGSWRRRRRGPDDHRRDRLHRRLLRVRPPRRSGSRTARATSCSRAAKNILAASKLDTHPRRTGRSRSSTRPRARTRDAYPICTYTYVDVQKYTANAAASRSSSTGRSPRARRADRELFVPLPPRSSRSTRRRSRRSTRRRESPAHVSTLDTTTKRPAAPSRGGGRVLATSSCRACRPRGARRGRARRPDRLQARLGREPGALTFGLGFVCARGWDTVHGRTSARAASSSAAVVLDRRPPPRYAARPRDRPLPQRACPRLDPGPGYRARRDARRDPERRDRALGDPRARPVLRDHVDPALHSALGFIPLFGPASTARTSSRRSSC